MVADRTGTTDKVSHLHCQLAFWCVGFLSAFLICLLDVDKNLLYSNIKLMYLVADDDMIFV